MTDQQTLDDLVIFGLRGGDSVYGIFNRTMTRQGAALLQEMFRHPLSDVSAIRQRSALFQYFLSCGAVFPFRSELFDIAETYLSVTDERTRLSTEQKTLGNRMASLIADNNEYKTIYKGITALMEILQVLRGFVERMPLPGLSDPYREEREAIRSLLAEGEMKALLSEDLSGKLSFTNVASYDGVLRFRHRAAIRRLLQHVYRLDVYLAVGKAAVQRSFVFPVALPAARHKPASGALRLAPARALSSSRTKCSRQYPGYHVRQPRPFSHRCQHGGEEYLHEEPGYRTVPGTYGLPRPGAADGIFGYGWDLYDDQSTR